MPKTPRHRRFRLLGAAVLVGALSLTACSNGAPGAGGEGSGADALLTVPREDMGSFSRNFNPFSPNVAPMTQQAIYESMLIHNSASGETMPWLAEKWAAAEDGKSLTFRLRAGVKWSDGEPLIADDVAYTFDLRKKLMGGLEYVDSVKAVDDNTVEFVFNKPYSPGVFEVGGQVILPKHVWEKVKDPAKETNADPVGTGPYTEVRNFANQSFDLRPNPHYWQPEKQKIAGVRMLAFAGNDGANLAAVNGEVDWAPQFIPNIQKVFVDKDPEHRAYWFPTTGGMIQWTLNTTKAPFDDVTVRKALSMAVDREQVTKIGMFGYTHPADCTGLSDAFLDWKNEQVADNCDWTALDVDAANKVLDDAGYTKGADGIRRLKDGSPFAFKISVGATSSDWLSVAQIIANNMREIGVKATVDSPDWSQVVRGYENGEFDTGIAWSGHGPTPYPYFRSAMSTETVKPVGEQTLENYHRFGVKAADELLDEFSAAVDEDAQQAASDKLQELYSEQAPVVPLFPSPEWGAYNDSRFVGWPSADNPYATLSDRAPTAVLVLTHLEPRA